MKYIDFIGQTVLLVATLILAVVFGGSGILIGQFFLGVMQMISSVISVITDAPLRKKKIIHLISALIYLAVLALIFTNSIFAQSSISVVMMMVPAWILAVYYYSITWSWAFSDTSRSKFLPNISF
jgi:hypothetical protein